MIGVVELSLFKESKIDKVKTAQAVKDFFADDFNHCLNLANKHLSDISSPTLDPNNVGSHDVLNHQDERMAINLDAQACVLAVDHTINSCSYPNNIILYLSFIKNMSNEKLCERLFCQSTKLNQLKNDACVEFAERLEYWRKKDSTTLEDLRVFENVSVTN